MPQIDELMTSDERIHRNYYKGIAEVLVNKAADTVGVV